MTEQSDFRQRKRALTELESTLLVEAAAGTGKTSLLAGRVVMLLADQVGPKSIAALTFTELAAGELRDRVSQYLEALLSEKVPDELKIAFPSGLTEPQKKALTEAHGQLDQLTCSTIHGFCHDLLRTYSVEAGIDPGCEILDADQADFAFAAIFDQWWRDQLNEATLEATPIAVIARSDPTGAETLLRNFAKFRRTYRIARPLPADINQQSDVSFVEAVRTFRRWCNQVNAPQEVLPEVDALEELAAHFEKRFAAPTSFAELWALGHPPHKPTIMRADRRRNDIYDLRDYRKRSQWKRLRKKDGERLADEAEHHYAICRDAFSTLMGRIANAIIAAFSNEIDEILENYEAFKRRAAVLDFDDLLYVCREALLKHAQVRQAAGRRFTRILVDEFQDTDPIQAEIIFLLASDDLQNGPWHHHGIKPGALFLVGDPKQAIYRFRGADLATYLLVRDTIERQFPDNVLRITANFRSRSEILEHVNNCFKTPLSAQQVGYVSLTSTRDDANYSLPCVAKIKVDIPPGSYLDTTRDEEARVVAETCARLIGNVSVHLNDGKVRPLEPGDIALLALASTDLWRYERALEELNLPFASQAGKNLFRRQEAQDLVALVRALTDARDTLALGSLLRGPLVGLTEQELLTITHSLPVRAGSPLPRLTILTDPSTIEHELARETLAALQEIRLRINSTAPAILLTEAIERLRVRSIVRLRSADQAARALANVDSLLARARNYAVRGLAQFASDLDRDWASGSSFVEGMVEADGRSISIVTVHSSKGLEWPVVIPINRASMPRPAEAFVYRRQDEGLHWALGQIIPPSLQSALQNENLEKRNENLRLLYVACTRAMEFLIVPDFTFSDDASWARQIDLRLSAVPELDLSRLSRTPAVTSDPGDNLQTTQRFDAEQAILDTFEPIKWIRPSDHDSDLALLQSPPSQDDEALEDALEIEGSRVRGIILHKLLEEILTGEVLSEVNEVTQRAEQLREQMADANPKDAALNAAELAATALRTLDLNEISAYREQLRPEVPIYGTVDGNPNRLIAGRADAISRNADGKIVVFDWKSDVSPKDVDRQMYRQQLSRYMVTIGAHSGAIVYLTLGTVDWVTPMGAPLGNS